MRRLRQTEKIRAMLRETTVSRDDLIYPIFVKEGMEGHEPIEGMPNQFRLALDEVRDETLEIVSLGIPAVILFGIPQKKDADGSEAYNPDGILQRAIGEIKDEVGDDLVVITDVCLC